METMNDLKALLKHEVKDLMSAEDQIIEALPAMIEKAKSQQLKEALQEHLTITETQRSRLDMVQEMLGGGEDEGENKGLFARLFGGGGQKCKAMEGIITEGERIMAEDMAPAVMDAAIIGAAQKVEHYEISSYGTARAFAQQLGNQEVARLLEQTLNEEYEADDKLTALAEGDVNKRAEKRRSSSSGGNSPRNSSSSRSAGSKAASAKSSGGSKAAANKGGGKKAASAPGISSGKKAASSSANRSGGKKAASSSASRSGGKKAGSSSSSNRGGSKKASAKSASGKAGGKKASLRRR